MTLHPLEPEMADETRYVAVYTPRVSDEDFDLLAVVAGGHEWADELLTTLKNGGDGDNVIIYYDVLADVVEVLEAGWSLTDPDERVVKAKAKAETERKA